MLRANDVVNETSSPSVIESSGFVQKEEWLTLTQGLIRVERETKEPARGSFEIFSLIDSCALSFIYCCSPLLWDIFLFFSLEDKLSFHCRSLWWNKEEKKVNSRYPLVTLHEPMWGRCLLIFRMIHGGNQSNVLILKHGGGGCVSPWATPSTPEQA